MYSDAIQRWMDTIALNYEGYEKSFTQEQIDNLLNHADFMENIEDCLNGHKFDMSVFYAEKEDSINYYNGFYVDGVNYNRKDIGCISDNCNAVMCAIGWSSKNPDLPDIDGDESWETYSMRLFGISNINYSVGCTCFYMHLKSDGKFIARRMRDVADYMKDRLETV